MLFASHGSKLSAYKECSREKGKVNWRESFLMLITASNQSGSRPTCNRWRRFGRVTIKGSSPTGTVGSRCHALHLCDSIVNLATISGDNHFHCNPRFRHRYQSFGFLERTKQQWAWGEIQFYLASHSRRARLNAHSRLLPRVSRNTGVCLVKALRIRQTIAAASVQSHLWAKAFRLSGRLSKSRDWKAVCSEQLSVTILYVWWSITDLG